MIKKSADEAEAAIKAIIREYADSLDVRDIERWGALWAEDGVQMPPGAPTIVGREKIVAGLREAMELFAFSNMQIHNDELHVTGDWAYARGHYTVTYVPHNGSEPIFYDGKAVSIFRKQADGSWKIYWDMFNSNVSP